MLAVLRQIDDAGIDRVLRRVDVDALALDRILAAGPGVGAVDQAGELGAAGADEAGDPEHLALVQLERAIVHPLDAVAHVAGPRTSTRSTARLGVVLLLVEEDRSRPTIICTRRSAEISSPSRVPT